MTALCPECGEPPHYHSFCTLCCQLFMAATRMIQAKPQPKTRRTRSPNGRRCCFKCKEIKPLAAYLLAPTGGAASCNECRAVARDWRAKREFAKEERRSALEQRRRQMATAVPAPKPEPRPPRWGAERVETLRKLLHMERLSYSEAAFVLGVTRNTIAGAVSKHLSPRRTSFAHAHTLDA